MSLFEYGILEGSMWAAKCRDILHGHDITCLGGLNELLREILMIIQAKNWRKIKRGLWLAVLLIWILLLPTMLLQFGSWTREVCSSDVSIIGTKGENTNDWLNSITSNKERIARVDLTFKQNFGIGMSTNAIETRGIRNDGRPGSLSGPVVYSFRQCLYWNGESYDGCESSQEIKKTFDSTVRIVPTTWTTTDDTHKSLMWDNLPYTQEV